MRIWSLKSDHKSVEISIENYQNHAHIHFDGRPLKDIWVPMKVVTESKGKYKDYPYFMNHIPIFTKKTLDVLEPIIKEDAEYFPVEYDVEPLWITNVVNVIDAVNYQKSKIRTGDDGSFRQFMKIVFNEKIVGDSNIFKLPQDSRIAVYVSDKFRDTVLQAGLKGFVFELIWDSEEAEDKDEQLKRHYEAMLAQIERNKGPEFDWNEATIRVSAGKTVASGKLRLQLGANGDLHIGELSGDGSYEWMDTFYIPPVLLYIKWHEVEKSEI